MASRPAAPTLTSPSGSTSLSKSSGSGAEHDPDTYIAQAEEKWNVLIDGDISLLASGLSELVGSFSTEDRPTLAQLSLPLLQNDLMRAAQGLLRTSQDLKLVLLARGAVQRRQQGEAPAEGEREDLEREVLELKQEIQALLSSGVAEKTMPEKLEEEKEEEKQGKGVEKSDDALGGKEQREGEDASKPTAEEATSSNGGNMADKGEEQEKEHEEMKKWGKEPEVETDVKEAGPAGADTEAEAVVDLD